MSNYRNNIEGGTVNYLVTNVHTGQQSVLAAGIVSNERDARVLVAMKWGGVYTDYTAREV